MKYRVLVVDDSVVMRRIVRQSLESDPEIEVVGVAANGNIALAMVEQNTLDAITLDIEMPEMDGLQTLRALRARGIRTPVIMFSTLTERGALATLDALAAGADDYAAKPSNVGNVQESMSRISLEVIPKIKALCWKNKACRWPVAAQPGAQRFPRSSRPLALPPRPPWLRKRRAAEQRIEIVAIGTSTGGPNALAEVLPAPPGRLSGADCDCSAHAAHLHPLSGRAPHRVFLAGGERGRVRPPCSSRVTPGSPPETST